MKIKKGDKVRVISGADKGKEGLVVRSFPKLEKVVVEGVNLRKKHRKPTQSNPEGAIVDMYAPIHVSNVALIDPKTKKPTKVGYKYVTQKDGSVTKNRVARKSGNVID